VTIRTEAKIDVLMMEAAQAKAKTNGTSAIDEIKEMHKSVTAIGLKKKP
jgi:hypothetical protein